ncbi:hypothetical protein SLE2022_191590 [Rubroshorea leprosula]
MSTIKDRCLKHASCNTQTGSIRMTETREFKHGIDRSRQELAYLLGDANVRIGNLEKLGESGESELKIGFHMRVNGVGNGFGHLRDFGEMNSALVRGL